MTETNSERKLGYVERLIQVRDYEPHFHYSQRSYKDDRGYDRHVNVPELWLEGKGETIKLRGTPMRKLVSNYMGLGYRKLCNLGNQNISREQIDDHLYDYYNDMTAQTLCLQERGNTVTRLTTDAFEGIDSEQVHEVITRRLDAEGMDFESKDRFDGVHTQYFLKNAEFGELSKDVVASVGYINKNTGENSFSMFGGGNVTVCTNGMIFGDLTARLRLTHKVDFVYVEKRIEQNLGEILSHMDIMPKQLMSLKDITVTKAEAEHVISNLRMEEYLKRAVSERLHRPSHATESGRVDWDDTLYGIYMSMTYVGSNVDSVQRSKNISVDVNVNHVSKLQDINTLRQAWDLREKELESTNAIKMEQ